MRRQAKDDVFDALPHRSAEFVEPMECLAVAKLPDADQWVYEILCGPPHKISSAAFGVMWRWETVRVSP